MKGERSFEAGDVRSDTLTLETSDARRDVKSIEVSDGRSGEVSLRASVLRYFPANSETSFLMSFQGSFSMILDLRAFQCAFCRSLTWPSPRARF